MEENFKGKNGMFASQVQDVVNCCRNGDLLEARQKMRLLRGIIGSNYSSKEMPNLVVLLDYIEQKLLADSKGGRLSSACPVEKNLKLLRAEYSRIVSSSVVNSKSVEKIKDSYSFNVVDGARPIVYWGQRSKQVLGLDAFAVDIAVYDQVCSAKKRIELSKSKPISNVFHITTPSYNSAKYIDSTILSIISQEGPFKIHYHIQDGGSTDGTVEKLLRWQSLLAEPGIDLVRCKGLSFSFESEKDSGMYDAISKGFDYLGVRENSICSWINSDDVFSPGAFASVWNVFASNDDEQWVIGATCGCDDCLEELSLIPLQFPQEVIQRGLCDGKHWRFIQQEGSFWKNSLWTAAGGLDSSLKYCGDWDLWRRFAMLVAPVHIEWPLGRFRIHKGQLTSAIKEYYGEMANVLSEEVRQNKLLSLSETVVAPLKMVLRPNKKGVVLTCEKTLLQDQYVGRCNSEMTNSVLNQMLKNVVQPPIKVMTMCTLAHGGAGTGTLRRISALRDLGVDVKLLSLVSSLDHEYVGRILPTLDGLKSDGPSDSWRYLMTNIRSKVMDLQSYRGQEFFSLPETVLDMRQLSPLFDEMDIVHLHWIVGMLDYERMPDVLACKPVFWTTGDMNPFTGGCHYSEGCEEFMRECKDCPMLSGESNLPHEAWKIKKRAYQAMDITVICPSRYIADLVKKSSLLGDKEIHVISNAYPVDQIRPVNMVEARKELNLPLEKRLLLFGADNLKNLRKGGDLLTVVVDLLARMDFGKDVEVVLFGFESIDLPLKTHYLGRVTGEAQMSKAYSAVDVFISLSREDVGPMTVVESMLCGTPVVGFATGVLPELVVHKSTGYCAESFSVDDVCEGIKWAMEVVASDGFAARCRSSAMKYGDPVNAANKHARLYKSKARGH